MDLLQIALIFVILVVAVMLSVLGIQVFLILRDLRKSLDKIDQILGSTQVVAKNIERPVEKVASMVGVVESGVKLVEDGMNAVKAVTGGDSKKKKSSNRFFKRL